MLTLTHVLMAIAAVVLWALFVLASPITRCRRCHGKAIIRTRIRKRIKACPRCRGPAASTGSAPPQCTGSPSLPAMP